MVGGLREPYPELRNIKKLFGGPELGLPRAFRNMYQTDKGEILDFNETWPDPPFLRSRCNGLVDTILKQGR